MQSIVGLRVFQDKHTLFSAFGLPLLLFSVGCESSSSSNGVGSGGGGEAGSSGNAGSGGNAGDSGAGGGDGGPSSCDGGTSLAIGHVSGTIGHDEAVILTGCGFGERSLRSGSFYESWNWGPKGDPVTTLGSPWSTAGDDQDPARFSDEFSRGSHTGMNLKLVFPDPLSGQSLNDMVYRQDFQVLPGDKVYVSNFFWSTYGGAREFGNECPQQWKLMNWLTHGPQPLAAPYTGFTWNAAGIDGPPDGDPALWVNHRCESGTAGDTGVHWGFQPPESTWWQVEIEYQVASAEAIEDGTLRVWFNGQLAGEKPTRSWCSDQLNNSVVNDGFVYSTFVLRNYIAYPGCDPMDETIRHDDTLLQVGSWARVALCDTDTWDSCRVRDYQPVTAWSDSSITVQLNQGAFETGSTAWLYVIDDAGARSSGHPVTFQ